MEILKHGKNWEIKHNIVTCVCGCKFIYNEDDIVDLPRCSGCFKHIVICPECERIYFISLSSKEEEDKSFVGQNVKETRDKFISDLNEIEDEPVEVSESAKKEFEHIAEYIKLVEEPEKEEK